MAVRCNVPRVEEWMSASVILLKDGGAILAGRVMALACFLPGAVLSLDPLNVTTRGTTGVGGMNSLKHTEEVQGIGIRAVLPPANKELCQRRHGEHLCKVKKKNSARKECNDEIGHDYHWYSLWSLMDVRKLDSQKRRKNKKLEVFEMCTWKKLLRVPGTDKRTNVSILNEINAGKSLEY
ncbi:hypothetical protein LAZ67_18002231 [Cordylochernes scorpioides]|uniref:Uncharacterized protein n=1 Tax=Cordylochernes scorpioides TaxID=51811 RepID=A0ABY6LJ74_9ARAC|nr:hypothetical protein LAZ67_18002231 [Cordylochernes scorpioides]